MADERKTGAPGYVIVSPVRNEGKYIEKTILSVVSQTMRPREWIIVDDGSHDATGETVDRYAEQYPWIRAIHRKDRGFRQAGGGVVDAFYDGYALLKDHDWDFIVKLDGDLSFEPDYFEKVFEHFKEDDHLGISGGGIYDLVDGKPALEEDPVFHVRGATKVYRAACWMDIGGLIRVPGWDTLDELKANMCGWRTKGFKEHKVIHHRHTGAAAGVWGDSLKNGLANYICGYHPVFMFFKCFMRAFRPPYVIHAAGLICGYVRGWLKKVPRIDDKALIDYIRKEQIKRLLLRPSIWTR